MGRWQAGWSALVLIVLVGCGGVIGPFPEDPDGGDAGPDARDEDVVRIDAGPDAPDDAHRDVHVDAHRDVDVDANDGGGDADAGSSDAQSDVAQCQPGYADCDGNPANGCEPLQTLYVDRDFDGWGSSETTLACGVVAGLSSYTGDCDDLSFSARPNQTAFFTSPNAHGFDFNCDLVMEKEYPDPNPRMTVCSNFGCAGSFGWVGLVPDCGENGTFETFDGNTWVTSTKTQACR